MKKAIPFLLLFLASSSFAFELSFDTINTGESKTLYVNSGNDTIRFDSARVDLVKSVLDQYQIELSCAFTDNATGNPTGANTKGFLFCNYPDPIPVSNLNKFQLELISGETIKLKLEGFDYCLVCIPENERALNPPQPMQAKMVFFTNKGVDSIIINGMQTNQPAPSALLGRRLPAIGVATAGQTEHYTISGKRINLSSLKQSTLSNGVGIAVEKHPDGSVSCRKSILTR